MKYDFSHLAANITRLRRQHGMTQESLAYQLGVTAAAVSKWERHLSCPDISLLPAVASIFSVSIDDLFEKISTEKLPIEGLPWEDDGEVRVVVFEGDKLCTAEVYQCKQGEDMVLIIHPDEGRHTSPMLRRTCHTSKTPPE